MTQNKIFAIVGSRPEVIKLLPLKNLLKDKLQLIHVEQHTDLAENICEFDEIIKIEEENSFNRLNNIFANVFKSDFSEYSSVLIQGDTATACAAAITAFNAGKKIIYLESGLRTYDLTSPYPEEAYRQIIARVANIHLCPTKNDCSNLKKEKIGGKKFIVGNTGLDNLSKYKNNHSIIKNKILITLHRRENIPNIKEWFSMLSIIAKENPQFEFIFPIHPNPQIREHKNLLQNINVIEPINHEELIKLMLKCKYVITDSGGIQEEASFLDIRTFICRNTTERPDFPFHILCSTPHDLYYSFQNIRNLTPIREKHICPFGDGHSSEKIYNILVKEGIISE